MLAANENAPPTTAIRFVLLVAGIGDLCAAAVYHRGWVCAGLLVRLKIIHNFNDSV